MVRNSIFFRTFGPSCRNPVAKVDGSMPEYAQVCALHMRLQSIGVRPYRPQTTSATTISATARRYRPQQKTISATGKINIGHNHIGQNHIGHKDIGHKIYGKFIWRHPDDTYIYVSVSCSPCGEFERERSITSASLCTTNTPKYTLLVIPVPHVGCVYRSHLLPGLPWGLNFNAHTHPIPTEKPVGIPTSTESRNPPYS